jgi:CHAD domain-containing protein
VEQGARAAPGLLEAVVDRLRAAGAGAPDPTPKVRRALGPRAQAPPELEPVSLGQESSVADVVRAAMVASVTRILRHDAGVRVGDDPEDVHQARVGARRLRSDLRTFAPVLDGAWAVPLRDELRWLGRRLGAVRDADVLAERLREQSASLPERDAAGLAPLLQRVAQEREAAASELRATMAGERYLDLLDRLVAGAREPALSDGAADAAGPAAPALVGRPWRHLRRVVRALPADPEDADLHAVRIRAKRARYAAEAVAPVVGDSASSFARAVARLQSVLGDHQDAVVAEDWLRRAVDGATAAEAMVAGELVALQQQERVRQRKAWPKAWRKAKKKKRRAWLD